MRFQTLIRSLLLLAGAVLIPACGGHKKSTVPLIPASVEFSATTANTVEGGTTVVLTVTRTGGNGDVAVDYTTANGTATAGADYTATTGTLTWTSTDFTSQSVIVPIAAPDAVIEGPETFTVTLSLPSGATLGTNTVSTVTIADADTTGTVQLSAATASTVEGAGTVTLTVTRTGGTVPVSVQYATANGTATAGADYTNTSGTLTWTAVDFASQNIVVPIAALDALLEGDETFTVTLSAPVGATLGGISAATVTIADADTTGVVQLTANTALTAEGSGSVTLSVTRTGGTVPVSVQYATANGTATAGADYTSTSGTLTWAAGDFASQNIVVPIAALDALLEGSETFTVTLSAPVGATLGANGAATVTITEGDTPAAVQLATTTYTTAEGSGSISIVVTRVGGTAPVSVQYATANGTATAGADYTSTSGTLNWAAGDFASQNIVVPIAALDALLEGSETFTVTLSAPVGAALGTNVIATVTITDGDTAAVVQLSANTAGTVEGAGTVTLTVTRTGGTVPVSVQYATANGTATAGADYTNTSGTLTWTAGDFVSQNIVVPIAALDALLEGPETFTVTLSAPVGATLGANNIATVTIADADTAAVVELSAATVSVAEGAAGPTTVTLTVTRTGGTAPVSVSFGTADVTASAGADYTAATGTLTWTAGDVASQSIIIPIAGIDGALEGDETFTLTLSAPVGATLGANSSELVTITEGDSPATVQFSTSTTPTAEGTTGTATVTLTVTRTGGTVPVTVQYASANGTATAGADYGAVSDTLSWTAVDFSSQSIIIPIADVDGLVEGDETFTVTLTAPTGAVLGVNPVATVTIADGDSPPDGVFEFSNLVYNVTEGASGTVPVTITVKRTGGSFGAVSVECLVSNGTATAGTDYTLPGVAGVVTLNWADGDAADKTFTIDILNDGVDAAGLETINLTLQNAAPVPGPEVSVSTGVAEVRILDLDAIGTLQFSAPAYTVSENGIQALITVSRLNGGLGAVGVDVVLGGGTSTAVAGVDYTTPGSTHLDWADADVADKTLVIPIIDNTIADGNRTLQLLLQNPTGLATISGTNPEVLTIADNEAGTFSFSSSTYAALEGNAGTSPLTITVTRDNGSVGAATVTVVRTGGTATLTTDFTLPAGPIVLNWADGDSAPKSFNITIVGDVTFEPDETIILALQNPTGASIAAPSTATATITNDELPPGGTFVLSASAYAVTEGTATVAITVNRVGLTTQAATVKFRTANGTAKGAGANRDYFSQNVTLTFGIGVSTQIVNITIVDDAVVEIPETFRVTLSTPSVGAVIGTPSIGTVTITSNE